MRRSSPARTAAAVAVVIALAGCGKSNLLTRGETSVGAALQALCGSLNDTEPLTRAKYVKGVIRANRNLPRVHTLIVDGRALRKLQNSDTAVLSNIQHLRDKLRSDYQALGATECARQIHALSGNE
jgi:hypothetical protein